MRGSHRLGVRWGAWCALLLALGSATARAQSPDLPAPELAVEPLTSDALNADPLAADALDTYPLEAAARAEDQEFAEPLGPARSRVEEAWRAPAADLEARVLQTRQAAVGLGAWSFDPAARAIAVDEQVAELERATAAVALAPDLPAAHMWRAEQLWLRGDAPMAALRAAFDALAAVPRHLEASLWFGGSALYVLAVALVAGGLLAIALAAAAGLPHAAHDLGHLVSASAPAFAHFAGLAALLLVPLALGEGALGLALGLFGVALIYGKRAQRAAMFLAALGVGLGAYPVIRLAGAALGALVEDPVAAAAHSLSQGIALPADWARLEAASGLDPLALRALAVQARRAGRLDEADLLYQRLLDGGTRDIGALNNAANVRLDLGQIESALALYSGAGRDDALVLFNLAQASAAPSRWKI